MLLLQYVVHIVICIVFLALLFASILCGENLLKFGRVFTGGLVEIR